MNHDNTRFKQNMDRRTIRKLALALKNEGDTVATYVNYFRYVARLDKDNVITLVPKNNGDEASSAIMPDDPRYVNGGDLFRAAVDTAKIIEKERKRTRAGPTGGEHDDTSTKK
jgi:hypothetical protein